MNVAEALGDRGLNLFALPISEIDDLLERRKRTRTLDRAYATAATAEIGLFVHAAVGRLDWPIHVTESSVQLVEYCADCYDYTCPHGVAEWSAGRDLCFFSAHYQKLLELLATRPEQMLANRLAEAYRLIESSRWELVSKPNDPDGIAKRVVTLLWSVKAKIIRGAAPDEDTLGDGLSSAADALKLPIFAR
jgi:hypothetical protein